MKTGTYTQQYVHLIFAVKYRKAALTKDIRSHVFSYMSGIITSMGHKSINVNGVEDHVHILLGLNPTISVSDTVYAVKRGSSLYINKEGLCPGTFRWQSGFGSFTYSRSQLSRVYRYIENQEDHHAKSSFKKEYIEFLERYEIDYDDRYLFDFWDE